MSRELNAVQKAVRGLQIPKGRILFFHVRLRRLKQCTGLSYTRCAEFLLKTFQCFNPITILVPSFTYTFTKSGIYHRMFSKSETGRFSEEVRLNFSKYRTPDPIFSILDVTGYLCGINSIDYNNAFDSDCIWEHLHNKDAIIVNFDIETMVSTQVHYIEKLNNVPYRYDKEFSGIVYYDQQNYKEVVYKFFARDLDQNRLLNWEKIEEYLVEQTVMHTVWTEGMKISWFSSRELMDCLSLSMQKDAYFLTV